MLGFAREGGCHGDGDGVVGVDGFAGDAFGGINRCAIIGHNLWPFAREY